MGVQVCFRVFPVLALFARGYTSVWYRSACYKNVSNMNPLPFYSSSLHTSSPCYLISITSSDLLLSTLSYHLSSPLLSSLLLSSLLRLPFEQKPSSIQSFHLGLAIASCNGCCLRYFPRTHRPGVVAY